MTLRRFFVALPALLLGFFGLSAGAQEHLSQSIDPSVALSYWTEERYATAVPLPWHVADVPTAGLAAEIRDADVDFTHLAVLPSVEIAPDMTNRTFFPLPVEEKPTRSEIDPRDVGKAKAHFSSSRIIPLDTDLVYPYRTVGKLFFQTPIGQATCSATVISRRLILTAGHCVHSGTASPGFYSNFVFKPAFRDGIAPFGEWQATGVIVTATWGLGGGVFPNAADYAIVELSEIQFPDGNFYRIGDVVGALGFQTKALKANHIQMLGYPVNLDSANKMHQVGAGIKKFTKASNTASAGSDMMQGSSGGPWIQNFGLPANGQSVAGGNVRFNRIVGVTSFGSLSKLPKAANSSMFDSRLVEMFIAACENLPGNC